MNALLTLIGWLDLAASITLAGGLLAVAVIAPPPPGRRVMLRATVVLALTLGIAFAVTAIRMHLISGLGGSELLIDVARSRWGRLWIVRVLGLGVLALGLRSRADARRLAVLAALWLAARSFQGHAGAHGTVPALIDWGHLVAVALWLGALEQVVVAGPIDAALAVRLRTAATAGVAVLVPAGIFGAFLHVPTLDALEHSPYGQVLIVKLVLAAVLLALGATNHFRHVPRLRTGDGLAGRPLTINIRLELTIATLVLLLSALLGVLPMPHPLP